MADQLLKLVQEKSESLTDLKYKFETLVQRAEESKKDGLTLSLPEFEAFGWERFDGFIRRLEDAVNIPLLEEARKIIEDAEMGIDQQVLDKLKSGLSVRRAALIEILREMSKELSKIHITSVKSRVKEEMLECLKESKWDDLITKVQGWQGFQGKVKPIIEKIGAETLLYSAVLEKALEEGPSTQIFEKLDEIESKAYQIGGDSLKKRIIFEKGGSQINPLSNVDEELRKIAEKKEDLRQITGEDIDLEEVMATGKSLEELNESLDGKYKEAEKNFKKECSEAEKLLRKQNNLALMLKRPSRSMLPKLSLRQLEKVKEELSEEIEHLEEELKASFAQDARNLIDALLNGKLPANWDAERILAALQEIVSSGYSFEIKRVE